MIKPNLGNMIEPVMKLLKKPSQKAGLPPGTPVFVGEKKAPEVSITVFDYDGKGVTLKEGVDVKDCLPFRDRPTITWINVDGLHEVAKIEELGKHFGLHPLTIEDILNTHQRPKVEIFDNYIFVVLKMHSYSEEAREVAVENVSIVLGANYVITFQERQGDVFDPVRSRINHMGRITEQGADYLAYSLMDVIVDNYFSVVEKLGERIEDIEDELIARPEKETVGDIHFMKRQVINLRRSVWPLREVVSGLQRAESKLIADSTRIYLRDLYDHTILVIETVESQRDIITGMLDVYLSSISNRLNDVMKFLTVFATIFIPLTFIAGIFGMNFKYMPELGWHYGYFAALGLMAAVGISLLAYFWKKKWL